ncbi:MAG: cation:H+ antiporter, partial [Flavobacteriales bacterium]
MGMDIFWLVLGLIILIFSGDYLVKGAVGIAEKFKISPLVIGM